MVKRYTILIADRNSHVREFLKREMTAAGYRVRLADKGTDVVKWVYHPDAVDLLILDPDLPGMDDAAAMKKIHNRIPSLPVVFHTFPSDYEIHKHLVSSAAFVEKRGNSVENLMQVVSRLLHDADFNSTPAANEKDTSESKKESR